MNVTPANINRCENGACAVQSEDWLDVGTIAEACLSVDRESSATKQSISASFTFDRHFYMSLIHFPNSPGVSIIMC